MVSSWDAAQRVGKQGEKEGAKLAEAYTHTLVTAPQELLSLALFDFRGCLSLLQGGE